MNRMWRKALAVLAVGFMLSFAVGYAYAQSCEDTMEYGEDTGSHDTEACQEMMGFTVSWCTEVVCDNTGLCPNGGRSTATGHCSGFGCESVPAYAHCFAQRPL